MAISASAISKRADGSIVTQKFSDINPDAADSAVAKVVATIAGLSQNTLTGIQKTVTSNVPLLEQNITLSGTAAADSIVVNEVDAYIGGVAQNVPGIVKEIRAGNGNDVINNSVAGVIIYGEAGNDKITNTGNLVTIYGGAGNDTITNTGDSVKIYGGDGTDSIINSGDYVSIYGEAANDTINNSGNGVYIHGNAGPNYLYNSGDNVTLESNSTLDKFYNTNTGEKGVLFKQTFAPSSNNATITYNGFCPYKDEIWVSHSVASANMFYYARYNQDSLLVSGSSSTIKFLFTLTEPVDPVRGFTIFYGSNKDSVQPSSFTYDNYAEGAVTLTNDDFRRNYFHNPVTLTATADNCYHNFSSIPADSSGSVIYIYADNNTVYGGQTNDTLICTGNSLTASLNYGDNVFSLGADAANCTVWSSRNGDDILYSNNMPAVFAYQGSQATGNDTIENFKLGSNQDSVYIKDTTTSVSATVTETGTDFLLSHRNAQSHFFLNEITQGAVTILYGTTRKTFNIGVTGVQSRAYG